MSGNSAASKSLARLTPPTPLTHFRRMAEGGDPPAGLSRRRQQSRRPSHGDLTRWCNHTFEAHSSFSFYVQVHRSHIGKAIIGALDRCCRGAMACPLHFSKFQQVSPGAVCFCSEVACRRLFHLAHYSRGGAAADRPQTYPLPTHSQTQLLYCRFQTRQHEQQE